VRQRLEIDDNGNGLANEKDVDNELAKQRYLGPAFVTGEDAPLIGLVMPTTVLIDTNEVRIWVRDVTDLDGISNVWAVVTPPDYDGSTPLQQTNLTFDAQNNEWGTTLTGLDQDGGYILTFYATDTNGFVSEAAQSDVIRIDRSQPDAYEPDDGSDLASIYQDIQIHTFHTSNDTDWIRFYAVSNFVYDIETFHFGTHVDTVLNLFYELPDGTLTNLDTIDEFGTDEGELGGLGFPCRRNLLCSGQPGRFQGMESRRLSAHRRDPGGSKDSAYR